MSNWYCYVGDQRYGPVEEAELRQWVLQGRVRPTDLVWCEGMADWTPAEAALDGMPPAAPQAYGPAGPVRCQLPPGVEPHRGAAVLVLGLVGFLVTLGCGVGFILGIVAWVMGSVDLRKMDAGRMDPSGRGLTQAGRILGIVQMVLAVLGVLFFAGLMAFAIFARDVPSQGPAPLDLP